MDCDPKAPDIFDWVLVNENAGGGQALLDAVIKPGFEGEAVLEIDDPGGAALASGQKSKGVSLRKEGIESRERVQVNVADGKPRTVRAVLKLLGTDGKPWMVITKEVKLNQPPENPGGKKRVPVVHTLPDGSRVVEYITSDEAQAKGLPSEGKPAAAK